MNKFESSLDEIFEGPLQWFGATSPKIASLEPTRRQMGLVSEWPEQMHDANTAFGIKAMAKLTGLLFPCNVVSLQFAEFGDFAFTFSLAGSGGVSEWLPEDVEKEAFVGFNNNQNRRWAMIGVAPHLAVGAIAVEKEFPPLDYSVENVLQTVVSVLPLRSEFLPHVAHLHTTETN